MRYKKALRIAAIFTFGLFAFTCNSEANKPEAKPVKFTIEKKWQVDDFSMPESVLVIPDHEWLYVSNVNGEEGEGYISKMSKDGVIDTRRWVEGIHTPTGMGYYDGNIFVADQSQIHIINIRTGKIVKTLPSDARTLNDISISEDGQVFASDLTTGSIYTVEGERVVLWLKATEFTTPNGVLVAGEDLIVGSVGTLLSRDLTPEQYGSLYTVNLADKNVRTIPTAVKIGAIDGVVPFREGVIISDPMSGKLFYITKDKRILLKENIEGGIADIGMEADSQIIYAPLIFGNSVIAYQLR